MQSLSVEVAEFPIAGEMTDVEGQLQLKELLLSGVVRS